MFKIGEAYTRRQIHEVLGGSVQIYLPTVQGRVVCACLTTKMNPGAPHVILVGNKPRVLQAAHQLVKQAEPIPIFLKKASNAWVYAGNFGCSKPSPSNSLIVSRPWAVRTTALVQNSTPTLKTAVNGAPTK